MVTFVLSIMAWAVIPFGEGLVLSNINVGIMYIFAVSSLGIYGIVMGRMGFEFTICVLGRATVRGSDGVVRSFDGIHHHYGSALCRLVELE